MKIINGNETFTRNEAAALTNVTISRLLFWEKKGLLKIWKDKENNYRYYINQDLQDVIRLNFYRNVGIPIHQLKNFPTNVDKIKFVLSNRISELEDQIRQIRKKQEEIRIELGRCEYISEFKNELFKKISFPFTTLIRKKLINGEEGFAELYSNYLNPMYQVYYFDRQYAYLAVESNCPNETDEVLYQYDPDYESIECLFIDKHEDSEYLVENRDESNNKTSENLQKKLQEVIDAGYSIKTIILQQIFPVCDDDNVYNDYYKLFLQVKKVNNEPLKALE